MNHPNVGKSPEEFFKRMKDLEENFITFLENQDESSASFAMLDEYLQNQKLLENKYELKLFLYLINAISNNYHRPKNFFTKIELIFKTFQEEIQQYFSSFEIFHIFQKNKRLLLLLFQLEIISPTEDIYNIIINNKKYIDRKYPEYFYPEFESYMDEKKKNSIQDQIQDLKESIKEFNQKRENGENDNYICTLIQNDSAVDFISYIEKNNISLLSTIPSSIYETNLFLFNKNPTLIEYSAFYGSIQIFKYLYNKKVEIKNSIWPYSIHGKNADIIHFLEEKKIDTLNNSFQYLIIESIKCHHNEITDYLKINFCENEKIYDYYLYRKSLKYYNFIFFTNEIISSLIDSCNSNQKLNIPYYLCKYDYFLIVEFLVNNESKLNLNEIYTIYKPSNELTNIVQCIAIKNGVVDQKSKEDEELEKKDIACYDFIMRRKEYTTYEYDTEQLTLLNIAVRKGNIDIIQLLLKLPGINTNSVSIKNYKLNPNANYSYDFYFKVKDEKTILFEAVESGYFDVVQFLLKNINLDVNCKLLNKKVHHDYFSTACMHYEFTYEKLLLHQAIKKGNTSIIKLLLSNPNIDINLESSEKILEAGGCIMYEKKETVIKKSSLYYAIKIGNIKLLQVLFEKPNIDVNLGIKEEFSEYKGTEIVQEKTPLYLAVEKQDLEIVKLLLENPQININFASTYCKEKMRYNRVIEKKTALTLSHEQQNIKIYELIKSKMDNTNEILDFSGLH